MGRADGSFELQGFFAKRGVTYDGEEVRVAQTLSWEGVRGSLPDEVGQLELRDFALTEPFITWTTLKTT